MGNHPVAFKVALAMALTIDLPIVALTSPAAREQRISFGSAALYARDIGGGRPLIVLHGGPDFDSAYLLPELDRLDDEFHLVYYDQRGRGKSAAHVQPEEVSLQSEIADVDLVRQHFGFPKTAVLGHSWGTVLALEYALRHPDRVTQLILLNAAPASTADYRLLRKAYTQSLGPDMERQRQMFASDAYKRADPDAVAARYRIHFEHALARSADYERLMSRMRAAFVAQGSAGILKARAVEDRLMAETWERDDYDLLPRLRTLAIPTLVISGDRDFIPADVAQHIAHALPDARLVTLHNCGHFSYMECGADVHRAIGDFTRANDAGGRR
jgi:proline iminopeptidase